MKKLLFLTITIGLFDGVSCFASGGYKLTNQIKNGGFEYAPPFTASTTLTQKWIDGTANGSATNNKYGWGNCALAGSVSSSFDFYSYNTGIKSLLITQNDVGSIIAVCNYEIGGASAMSKYGIGILPQKTYYFSVDAKTVYREGDSTGVQLSFCYRNSLGTLINCIKPTAIKTTTNWTTYNYSGKTIDNTAIYVVPKMSIEGSGGAATLLMDAWIDNIRMNILPATAKTSNKVLTRYANP